ncbi:MAG: methylenetetrahydrofolate reductase C-terminal domain-containing protein [Anaerolineae bacterium]|nr:methylenetetrahydrofolate reductase C-terminal domain-containing protein [Anaerolineae bacterium]
MIIGEQKPLDEIKEMIADYQKILILGCGTCVTVCFAGGEKEVGILASALRMATRLDGQGKEVVEATVQRQCEYEYNEEVADLVREAGAVLSLACGIGVQTMNEQFPDKITLPGLNTTFLGQPTEQGVWAERCQACGNCLLALTAGVCPIARCSKSLLNGPCGGSNNGQCEIDPKVDCAWQLIYERLKSLGRLGLMTEIQPARDWSTSRDGGPRKIVREDLRL